MINSDPYFERVKAILERHQGHENAITIDALCRESGCMRLDPKTKGLIPDHRVMEDLLETRDPDFPFLITGSAKGMFVAVTAAEINQYLDRCQGRCVKLFIRKRTYINKALRGGFVRVGKYFIDPPKDRPVPVQTDFLQEIKS